MGQKRNECVPMFYWLLNHLLYHLLTQWIISIYGRLDWKLLANLQVPQQPQPTGFAKRTEIDYFQKKHCLRLIQYCQIWRVPSRLLLTGGSIPKIIAYERTRKSKDKKHHKSTVSQVRRVGNYRHVLIANRDSNSGRRYPNMYRYVDPKIFCSWMQEVCWHIILEFQLELVQEFN